MELQHLLANGFYNKKKYKLAIQIYLILLENNYKKDIINSNISGCYLKLKNYKIALQYALEAVTNNINYDIAWGRIGYAYRGLLMYHESLEAFKNAYKINNKELYKKKINELSEKLSTPQNIFNIIKNNKTIFNKILELKKDITNLNINNNKIQNIIKQIINDL